MERSSSTKRLKPLCSAHTARIRKRSIKYSQNSTLRARARLRRPSRPRTAAAEPATVAPPKAPAPTSAASSGVEGRVEIDAKLASKVAPGDTLFIFARDPEGSRMPLAVVRGSASELPKSFALTDAMAMTPNNTISRARTVVVEARTSKSGSATPQSGDLRGVSAPVPPGAGKVRVVIDQVVP